MKTVTITVTAADLREGVAQDCWQCPVALAVRRATGLFHVVVTKERVSFLGENNEEGSVLMPAEARRSVAAIDAGRARQLQPFGFLLRVPGEGTP